MAKIIFLFTTKLEERYFPYLGFYYFVMQLFSGVPKNWPHFAIFEGFVIIIAKMIDFMLPIQKHDSKLVWKIYLNQMTPEIIEIIFELIKSI